VIDYKFTSKPVEAQALLLNYALQLRLYAHAAIKLLDFEPVKIEGFLVHFTETSFQIIPAPASWFGPSAISNEVSELFARAKSEDESPQAGEHCRYCEVRESCPAKL